MLTCTLTSPLLTSMISFTMKRGGALCRWVMHGAFVNSIQASNSSYQVTDSPPTPLPLNPPGPPCFILTVSWGVLFGLKLPFVLGFTTKMPIRAEKQLCGKKTPLTHSACPQPSPPPPPQKEVCPQVWIPPIFAAAAAALEVKKLSSKTTSKWIFFCLGEKQA